MQCVVSVTRTAARGWGGGSTCEGLAGSDADFMRLEGEVSSAAAVADADAASNAGEAASDAFLLLMLCLASCKRQQEFNANHIAPISAAMTLDICFLAYRSACKLGHRQERGMLLGSMAVAASQQAHHYHYHGKAGKAEDANQRQQHCKVLHLHLQPCRVFINPNDHAGLLAQTFANLSRRSRT